MVIEVLKKEFERLAKLISKEEIDTNPEIYSRLQRILQMLRDKQGGSYGKNKEDVGCKTPSRVC